MAKYLEKNIDNSLMDVDEGKQQVKVAIAKIGNVDLDNDVFEKGAFNKTLKERGPQGANDIWHLIDHTPRVDHALGKFKEMGIDGDYVYGVSHRYNSKQWETVWPLYESLDLQQHSAGFSIVNSTKSASGTRIITEVKLYEGSAVLWGANPETQLMELWKSQGVMPPTTEAKHIRLHAVYKALTKGNLTQEQLSLLALEIKQIESELIEDKGTQAAEAPEPQAEMKLDAAAILSLILIS